MTRKVRSSWWAAALGLWATGCVDDGGLDGQPADACVGCGDAADVDEDAARPGDATATADTGPSDARVEGDGARPDARPADASVPDLAPGDLAVEDLALPDLRPGEDASPDDLGLPADAEADLGADGATDAQTDAAVVSPCPDGRPPAPERCNTLDDDCDGSADEDFAVGSECEALGRCSLGFVECDAEGEARCSTEPGGSVDQSLPERCNGRDDDCDGEADENPASFDAACYEGPAGTLGVGTCTGGVRRCANGALGGCEGAIAPRAEACNGRDDDCDAATDEGYVVVAVCGVGRCRDAARPSSCVGGVEVACRPGAPVNDDANCNGLDDDCDGATDEGFVPEVVCGTGECAARATPSRCDAGRLTPCNPAAPGPSDGVCDGRDEDCDGRTDENYQPTLRCGTGICAATATPSRCEGGAEVRCVPGEPTGDDTSCDNIDEDCDGSIDEGFVPDAACGLGVCAAAAVPGGCVVGVVQLCLPGLPTGNDADCNGLDDDCDGAVDEGYVVVPRCGVGQCGTSSVASACIAGVERLCAPGAPIDEAPICNGFDDDCDGAVDETAPQLSGAPVRLTLHQNGALDPALIAAHGSGFAAAWADNRADAPGIYFARLGPDGVLLAGPTRITAFIAGQARNPSLSLGPNGSYAVALVGTAPGNATIYFARIGADGAVVQQPVALSDAGANAVEPSLVFNGGEFAVAWSDQSFVPAEIVVRRLNTSGQTIGAGVRITNVPGAATLPSLVHRGLNGGYAVAYNENLGGLVEAWIQRINVNGAALGGRLMISDNQGNSNAPRLVATGNTFAATWYDTRDNNAEIYFARLSTLGVREGELVRVTETLTASTLPTLFPAQGGFVLAYTERVANNNDEIFVQRLTGEGALVGLATRVTNDPASSFRPAVAHDGQVMGVAWYDLAFGAEAEILFHRGPLGCPP